jgi:hypothetical protein
MTMVADTRTPEVLAPTAPLMISPPIVPLVLPPVTVPGMTLAATTMPSTLPLELTLLLTTMPALPPLHTIAGISGSLEFPLSKADELASFNTLLPPDAPKYMVKGWKPLAMGVELGEMFKLCVAQWVVLERTLLFKVRTCYSISYLLNLTSYHRLLQGDQWLHIVLRSSLIG